ncbi:MAG: hypothetical protein H8D56_26925 [Planctomycetes bacterium]|nr:hypothetical protein [Planctomycetota bacterium]MBL7189997.1 hypothetical protein [Phycisphaerae bacterium]
MKRAALIVALILSVLYLSGCIVISGKEHRDHKHHGHHDAACDPARQSP